MGYVSVTPHKLLASPCSHFHILLVLLLAEEHRGRVEYFDPQCGDQRTVVGKSPYFLVLDHMLNRLACLLAPAHSFPRRLLLCSFRHSLISSPAYSFACSGAHSFLCLLTPLLAQALTHFLSFFLLFSLRRSLFSSPAYSFARSGARSPRSSEKK